MKILLTAFCLWIICTGMHAQTDVLPTPAYQEKLEGELVLHPAELTIEKGILEKWEFAFIEMQCLLNGVMLIETEETPDIDFQYRKHLLPEAYDLIVDDDIQIAYNSAKGRFYALVTLMQLLRWNDADQAVLQKVKIEDAPKFAWRGLHLDVSRHFFTVKEVKRFLDLMALYKFNTFHWHLTDDQGWRIEIKKYPKLTEVGGFRDSTLIGHYTDTPRRYDTTRYGGFYTQEEIKEVVAYAKSLHIDVVPEIEMPGHSRAAIAAYPELSCTGEELGVPGLWGVFDDIYCANEATIVFLQDVLDEVLTLFPSEYIHIGGDEAPKKRWKESEVCQKVMEDNNLKDEHELQSYFIKRMDAYLAEKGRKLIGWDEILEGGLSPNAAVMSWRGESGGIEAAKQGHHVVMSPTSYCYFDYYQSSSELEPLAIGGFLPLEKVYEFDPVPEQLTKEESKFILGGQANVWTEYIETIEDVEYMVYPRAIALMQSLWCHNKPDYKTFLKSYLDYHEGHLSDNWVNYSRSIHIPKLSIDRIEDGIAYTWNTLDTTRPFYIDYRYDLKGATTGGGGQQMWSGESFEVKKGRGYYDLEVNFDTDQHIDYLVYRSDLLGAKIEMNPPPHRKYDHNGSLNLVDGILGTERWKGDQWLGFKDKRIELTVDLGTIQSIDSLTIGFLNQNGSWIYLPQQLKILYSKDGEDWEVYKWMRIVNSDQTVYRLKFGENVNARHIKFEITPMNAIPEGKGGAGNVPWTFIDEIQMFTE